MPSAADTARLLHESFPRGHLLLKIANEIQHHEFRMIKHTEERMATWYHGTRSYAAKMPDYEFAIRKEYIEETALQ
jgi:hypothetical protein